MMKKRRTLSPIQNFDSDIVYEILTWLPAKSLMRFKGISKFWKSTMEHDSFFIQLHRRRSGARIGGEMLLLHLSRNYSREHKFISIDNEGRTHITEYNISDRSQQVLVLDGFLCFYSDRSSTIFASLYNLSTLEFIALPKDSNFNKGLWRVSFFTMGFDPSHTLCKILHKTNPIRGTECETGFEVYTVGDPKNCWRIINSPPFECHYCDPCNHGSICINGVIFWFSHCGGENKCYGGEKITAFDVSDESFNLISIPRNCYVRSLRNVDGVLTLMDSNWLLSGFGYVKLWKLEDYKNQVWVVENILIDIEPRSFMRCWEGPNLIGTNCCGEILMIQLDGIKVLIYNDRARGISKVVELDSVLPPGVPFDNRRDKLFGYTFVENIMPLKPISN